MKRKSIAVAFVTVLMCVILGIIVACNPFATPCLTASEQNYDATLADHNSRFGEEWNKLVDLLEEPQIENDEWRTSVDAQLATIRPLYDEALEIEPPSSMAHIHDEYTQAMYHFDMSTDLIAEAIDTQNADLLNQAISEMELGIEDMEETTRLYDDFIAARCP